MGLTGHGVAKAALACAVMLTWSVPTSAAEAVRGSAVVCSGTVDVGYAPAIQTVQPPTSVKITLTTSTALTCTGGTTMAIDVSGTDLAAVSCIGPIAAVGAGTVTMGAIPYSLAWVVSGLTPVQSWVFSDETGASLLAVGLGISTDIGACLTVGSVSSMSLAATIVVIT